MNGADETKCQVSSPGIRFDHGTRRILRNVETNDLIEVSEKYEQCNRKQEASLLEAKLIQETKERDCLLLFRQPKNRHRNPTIRNYAFLPLPVLYAEKIMSWQSARRGADKLVAGRQAGRPDQLCE